MLRADAAIETRKHFLELRPRFGVGTAPPIHRGDRAQRAHDIDMLRRELRFDDGERALEVDARSGKIALLNQHLRQSGEWRTQVGMARPPLLLGDFQRARQ